MRLRRFVTGWAVLEISGDGPERLLSAAAEAGVAFWDVSAPVDFAMTVCVRHRDMAQMEALVRRLGLDCRTIRAGGWPLVWRALRLRKALLAALCVCVLALVGSRLFIWRVEIPYMAGVPESELRAALAECGVDVGVFWPGFSQDLTRNALLRRLPELRWATVNLRGGCAEVIVRPKREAPAVVPEGECADIVAARGGYITQVQALRGKALVKPGQTVIAGETLISGEAVGRYASHGAVRAQGEVRARTWYELTAAAPIHARQTEEGRCISTRWALEFGKKRINFYKGCSICPPSCAKMEEETVLAVPGVFSLPLRLVRERVYETRETSAADDTLTERMQGDLLQRLRASLDDEGEVLQTRFSHARRDGWMLVTLHAECSESIGTTVPMTAAQIAAKSPQTEEEKP